jgi:hypothetical protein
MCNKNSLDWGENDKKTVEVNCGGAAFIRHGNSQLEQHEA